jgi:hypothetical protein
LPACAIAQEPAASPKPPAPPPSLLRQVVPKPTGANGYEDLLAAVDALRTSRRFAAVEEAASPTLDAKRRALRDPPVLRALELVRRGLGKPVTSPREKPDIHTLFPEYGGLRSLARLLATQQYVLLADGRVSEAIGSLRLGLRLGTAIQTDTLLSGLVGIAADAVALRRLGSHLDQLSARDCEQLFQLCRDWLQAPDPAPRILETERRFGKQLLADMWKREVAPHELLGPPAPGGPLSEVERKARQTSDDLDRAVKGPPAALAALLDRTEKQLDALYNRMIAEFQKPAWERKLPAPPDGDELPDRLIAMIMPAITQTSDKYTGIRAQVQLLACHAAIRRHRWEHDRLPVSLAEVKLGDLAVDPFNGQPFRYEPRGRQYRLTSIGPVAAADDPQAVDGRRPISFEP